MKDLNNISAVSAVLLDVSMLDYAVVSKDNEIWGIFGLINDARTFLKHSNTHHLAPGEHPWRIIDIRTGERVD